MMKTDLLKTFTWEIDNFSERTSSMKSPLFSSGGCDWNVLLHPKGDDIDDHLSLYLCVPKPKSLKLGWRRVASFGFVILNQSGQVLHTTSEGTNLFGAEVPGWGFRKAVPLSKLLELVENNTLIIDIYTKVYEVVHEGVETKKEIIGIGGFQVLASQVISVSQIFVKHPKFAENISPKSKAVKTAYMNILLGLNETLHKPQESISDNELINAQSELSDLTEAGFNLDWLESKLDEISTDRKKLHSDTARLQELHENVKTMEHMLSNLRRELYHETNKYRFDHEDDDDDDNGNDFMGAMRNRQRRGLRF